MLMPRSCNCAAELTWLDNSGVSAPIAVGHAQRPHRFAEHALQQRPEVDERGLQHVRGEQGDLLVVTLGAGELGCLPWNETVLAESRSR
jgi:hypothetical protein